LGWIRPVVLIPISALSGLSSAQIEAIIAHELAHIKRYDGLVNLFQITVETVLFYHPGIWWVNRIVRTERENCCDDVAVAVCGNPSEYARALAMLSASSARPVWAMAANGGALKSRVARLLGFKKITHGLPRTGLAIFALLCASCVLIAAGAFKQDVLAPPPPAQNSEDHTVGSYIDSLAAVGLTKLTVDELISLKIQGVTADYVRELRATGLKPGIPDLLAMKIQGVTPQFVRALQGAGLGDLQLHDFLEAKIQGITPEFIRGVRSHGFKDLTFRQLISLKMAGIF
jgi:hypothetical protein